jgi:hypothetical protein
MTSPSLPQEDVTVISGLVPYLPADRRLTSDKIKKIEDCIYFRQEEDGDQYDIVNYNVPKPYIFGYKMSTWTKTWNWGAVTIAHDIWVVIDENFNITKHVQYPDDYKNDGDDENYACGYGTDKMSDPKPDVFDITGWTVNSVGYSSEHINIFVDDDISQSNATSKKIQQNTDSSKE